MNSVNVGLRVLPYSPCVVYVHKMFLFSHMTHSGSVKQEQDFVVYLYCRGVVGQAYVNFMLCA